VKGECHQAALISAVLARQEAAAVGMRTCWPWETAAVLPSARRPKALRRPLREERGGAYRGGHPPTACLSKLMFDDVDIDECAVNNGGCSALGVCTNTPGGFACTCLDGYAGDGYNCTGKSLRYKLFHSGS